MEAGAIAVRRVRKEDMRHVAKATGATLVCSSALSNHSSQYLTYIVFGCLSFKERSFSHSEYAV